MEAMGQTGMRNVTQQFFEPVHQQREMSQKVYVVKYSILVVSI